jgi:phospholipase/carboxylesterase
MPLISLRNYVAVAPRGFDQEGDHDAQAGERYYDWPQTPEHIQEAQCRVDDCLEAAHRRWSIAPNRIFLAGFGAGATMAFRVAMSHPRPFAGVVSLCGAFPTGYRPFVELQEARKLPIFLAVGRDSAEYSPRHACDDLRLFHTAGISVTLRQYPSGQQMVPQMFRDVDRWIIEQITPPADAPQT